MLVSPALIVAQDTFKNEEAMVKEADELFRNEEYVKAYEYYQTLLSNHRDNAQYSYRFGVCMMYSDKRDKSKPIKYLEKAAKTQGIDIKVFYFLGRAYHQNYSFNEAEVNYKKYKNTAKSKVVAKYNIDRRIQECENGLALLSHIHLLYVVNKVEVKESTFYRTYNMNNSGGIVIMKPDELKTKYDRKHNTERTAFYVPSNRILYFSSYGNKGVNGKDIYRAHQLSDGSWSEPEKLSANINTTYDEAYPFISLDGQTLYFSSKGHNSMGGFDIFKSTFDAGTFDWSATENLNFPINTPFDDIFFVPDTMNKFASFSSTRSSVDGLIYVYKIGLNRQEEEQDFAKVLTKGGDIAAALNLIKDVADLKTNINIDEYKKKIADITDTSLAINNQSKPKETHVITPKVDAALANFDTEEAVDSVFGIYRDLKYRVVGFNKQKKSIQEIYHKNKLQSQAVIKEQGVAGAEEAAKYKKAADIALEIKNKLDQEIKQTEKASSNVMDMAANIQYYNGRGMKDSVKSVYDRAVKLNNSLAVNTDIAKEVVDAQYTAVKTKREQASKFYDLSKGYDKQIADLKSERDEYAAEAERLTDADVKQEYLDLVTDMNKDIAKKEAEKETYYNNWKSTRDEADSMSNEIAIAESVINNYNSQTKDVDFDTYSYVNDSERQVVDAKIAENRIAVPTEVVAINDTEQKPDNNSNNQQQAQNTSNTNKAGNVKPISGGVVVGANNSNNKTNATNTTNQNQGNTNANWKDNPETVALVNQASTSIAKLEKNLKEQNSKVIIAKDLASKKYNEFQKISDATETKLSTINTNTSLSANERNKQLNEVKKDIVKGNDIKQEAAAAYMIAAQYEENYAETKKLVTQATQQKTKIESLVAQGKISEAKKLSNQIKDLEKAASSKTTVNSNNQAEIAKLSSEKDQLNKKEDIVKADIEKLKAQKNQDGLTKEEIAQIDTEISNKQIEEQKLLQQIDFVEAKKEANAQIARTEQSIETSYSKNANQNIDVAATQKIPAEFQNRASLVGVFSSHVLDEKMETVDSYLKTAVVAQNTGVNTVKAQEQLSILEIPNYNTTEQNQAAEQILKPRVDAIQSYEAQNKNLDKRITVSLKRAKDYNTNLKSKNKELNAAYAKIDTAESLTNQKSQVAKIKTLEKEALNLQRNQESAMQYANILKSRKEDNVNKVDQLTKEVKLAKELIAQNDISGANEKTKLTNVNLAKVDISSKELTSNYVSNYKQLNNKLDNKIAKVEDDLSTAQGSEAAKLTSKLNKLKSQRSQNTAMIASIERQAKYMDTEADLSSVDSAQIAHASKVPIVAVNSEIFNPNYLKENSEIEQMASREAVIEQQKVDEQIAQNEVSDEGNIEAMDHLSNVDAPFIKHDLLVEEQSLLDEQIDVLSQRKAMSDDLNEKQNISRSIRDLQAKKVVISKEIASLDINKDDADIAYYNAKKMNLDEAVIGLQKQSSDLVAQEKQLRTEAENLRGKAKKVKLAEADELHETSMKLNLEVVEIVALNNKKKYRENELKLAQYSEDQLNDIRAQRAIAMIRFAKQNMTAGQARREMAAEDGYSDLERNNIIDEAVNYENKAINYQVDALKTYDDLGIVAVVKPKEEVVAVNAVDTTRSAEEIPADQVDNIAKADNQNTEATTNKPANVVVTSVVVAAPIYGIVFKSDNSDTTVEAIVENAAVTPEGLVYKVQMATYQKDATSDEFNGIAPVAAEKVDNSENVHYVAGTFANYDDASKARETVKTKGFPEAFVVAYFDGKRISTNEARQLIAEGKAYTDPELAKYASEHNSAYYTQQVATNEPAKEQLTETPSENQTQNISQNTGNNTNVVIPVVVPVGGNNNQTEKTVAESDTNRVDATNEKQNTEVVAQTEGNNANAVVPVVVPVGGNNNQTEKTVAESDTNRVDATNEKQNAEVVAQTEGNNANTVVPVVVPVGGNNNQTEKAIAESDTNRVDATNEKQNAEVVAQTEGNNANAVVPVVIPVDDNNDANQEDTTKKDIFDVPQEVAQAVVVEAPKQTNNDNTSNEVVATQTEATPVSTTNNVKPTTELGIVYTKAVDDSKPIADNNDVIPVGLVYKVQMAAFRNEVPMSTFKGINPIAAERAPNSAYIRYVAGVFPNYNSAVSARNIIRTKGFKDAFVVVYFNGKRISVGTARQLIASGEAYSSEGLSQFAINNNTQYYKRQQIASDQVAENNATVTQTQQPTITDQPQEVVAETPVQQGDIPTVNLYYSVQIGVFGGPRSAERLYNVSDIYFDRTSSGYYRYFSGKFDNEQSAKRSRDRIRVIGIRDAFVVVFRNGQRITMSQARKLESDARNNLVVLKRDKITATTIAANTNTNQTSVENTNQTVEVKPADNPAEGIVFKVQLGAYRGTRNAQQLRTINAMSQNGISSYTTPSGLTIYFTNSYKTYNEARAARNNIVAAGHTDVFVVAMQNGKKMNLRRAMDLLNQ